MDKEKIKKEFKHAILDLVHSDPFAPVTFKQICHYTGSNSKISDSIAKEALSDLIKEGKIAKFNKVKYIVPKDKISNKVTGIISVTKSGTGYVKAENQKDTQTDIYINFYDITDNHVLDGDKVELVIVKTDSTGRRFGRLIRVVRRTSKNIIGKVEIYDSQIFVSTQLLRTTNSVFIPKEYSKGVKNGEKVIVRIIDWKDNAKCPSGKITEILGKAGENETEMHSILSEYDLPYNYPARLEKIADKIDSGITPKEIAKRRDMRNVCTFTIDPATAKDFDDALSIQKLKNGNWEVGVHIADVSFYVHPGDDIDGEGYQRATSVYLVDRTVPMLPERLSNFLCSLRPNEEKLCFSAIFEMDDNAQIKKQWIGRTIINSNRRFTYDEAQDIIEGNSQELSKEIKTLDSLAKKLRDARFKSGAINFERSEPQFELDEKGSPIRIYFKEMKDSNQLVEEFMLLANRSVAELIGNMHKTFVYRVHDVPDPNKYDEFVNAVRRWGYSLKKLHSNKKIGSELTSILGTIKGKPEANIISNLAVRTMSRAKYTTQNIGHYGLAFKYYTHFTSPIRRYPDIMVHRLLDLYLNGGGSVQTNLLEEDCEHCSAMEIRASDAERSSIKYKMIEFMKDKVGNEYDGIITSLSSKGIFVELEENHIEGMIPIFSIHKDYFEFNYDRYCLQGMNSGVKYFVGDKIRIRIVKADLNLRHLDFKLI